ncbi:MAG TPA: two-component regulator propeller domain-containing protein [Usitatibacter sp.]|nr:two-component regulator propeller domain-containing protein [Usitatibacter sp.]
MHLRSTLLMLLALALPAMAADAPPTAAERTGKTVEDKSAPYTHFRVGNKNVKSMLLEGSVLWVGTSGGVIRYDTKTDDYRLYDNQTGLLSNGIFHIGRIRGRLAVGTYGGGLSLLDEKSGKWDTYNIPEGLGDAFVYDVLEAKNGDIWIATWSGVNRIRGGNLRDRSKWDLYTVDNTRGGVINDWIYGLAEGKDGIIWMATEGGLVKFQNGKWENWNHARGLGADYERVKEDIAFRNDPSKVSQHHAKQKQEMGLQDVSVAFNPNYIIALAVDRDGVVWAGTWGGGLSRYDGKAWKSYTTNEGLPGNHVSMLHVDGKGTLWIGTNNGIAQLHDGKFTRLTREDGLFADTVFSMTAAPDGSIWVGSFGGVAHIRQPRLH